jgi:hypothetical protein
MTNPFISFVTKIALILTFAFAIHLGLLKVFNQPLFENKIILSYCINLFMVIGVFGLLFAFKNRFMSQLGFLFLGGSLLKFAIFFIVFHPVYREDGVITKLEFAAFFVPYVLGLAFETFSLSKWLNNLDEL